MKLRFPRGIYRLQSLLLFAVFKLFLCNALGVIHIRLILDGDMTLHPHMLTKLFNDDIVTRVKQLDFLIFLLDGAILAILLPTLRPISASLMTLAGMVPPFYVAWTFPLASNLVPLEYTLVAILILYMVNVLSSYFVETHQRQKIIAAFGHYVPPELADEISRDPQALSMVGVARELSVMFCDIRNFSTISERLEPSDLATMLNHYLTAMTDVLHANGATIDKYIGDAIMAFWGAPLSQHDHAQRAVISALCMQQRMVALRDEFRQRGWPELEIGIGINSGVMNVGNMGSRYRVAYTVLGDAVNLAARLEALTRLYQVDVLVSASTCAAVPGTRFREIDHVRVKGKGEASRIFEPLADDTPDAASLPMEGAAMSAYYSGDWDAAISKFRALKATGPALAWYDVMLTRMTSNAIPHDWDGVISFASGLSDSITTAPTAQHCARSPG
jgi:adenylate cyclase